MSTTSDGKTKRDRDGAVGLRYVGTGAAFADIPARDLSDADLAEITERIIAQAEAHAAQVELPPDADPPKMPTARSIRKMLLDSGLYIEAPITAPAPPVESEG